MSIQEQIKNKIKDLKISRIERIFYRVILGEFNRIGKTLTDDQCLSVIKKMIKNNNIILKDSPNNKIALSEKNILEQFVPKTADKNIMLNTINSVLNKNTFKNKMQAMKPCINKLEELGYDVNKGELSRLLKNV